MKANDPDAYITFEDSFAAARQGGRQWRRRQGATGRTTVATTVTAYLEKYPG